MIFRQVIIDGKNGLLSLFGIIGVLLTGFSFCWYFFLNRYTVLLQEQSQMFLFTPSYLFQYLHRPGGVSIWTGAFLTQFFIYPLAGACIYSLVFLIFGLEYRKTLTRFAISRQLLPAAYIPALLILPAVSSVQFDIGSEIAIILALLFFRILTFAAKQRYAPAIIFVTVILSHIITGGNATLTLVLFLIFSLQHSPKNRFPQIASAIAAWLLSPFLFRHIIYPVSIDQAFSLYTPFDRLHDGISIFRDIAWLSVAALPIAGLTATKIVRNKTATTAAGITAIAATLVSITAARRPDTERIMEMVYQSAKNNWPKVLSIAKTTATGPFQCFYLNLALQQTGNLPDSMFHYSQIGVSGLFLDLQDYLYCYAAGDLFVRLGLLNEIQRCSYESMVSRNYYREYDVRNIKRLFECAVAANDSILADKYRSLLNKTLFYRNIPSSHSIPVTAAADVLIEQPSSALEAILRQNPRHRPAFEYLMAYYMLEREYDKAKKCFDACYAGLGYRSLPVHYAEFLMLYKQINRLDDSFYGTYPIPLSVRERFDMIDVLLPNAHADPAVRLTIERQFKDTYWFYVAFPLVDISHTNRNEKKILY
jgi:tetratricopeptide (TPR) repeat protein